jgi:arsenate reductase
MTKIYHNPRCAKSREALKLLEEKGIKAEVVKYMETPLTPAELEDVLTSLEMEPEELIRKGEKIWKEEYADKELEREEFLLAMIEHPQLMERPIVEHGEKAVVARPSTRINELFNEG